MIILYRACSLVISDRWSFVARCTDKATVCVRMQIYSPNKDSAYRRWIDRTESCNMYQGYHDDVIKWKHFPHNWAFVRGEFPAQTPVTRSFDIFFDLRLNKRLSKQSWGWGFETLSRPLWRHCNDICHIHSYTFFHGILPHANVTLLIKKTCAINNSAALNCKWFPLTVF